MSLPLSVAFGYELVDVVGCSARDTYWGVGVVWDSLSVDMPLVCTGPGGRVTCVVSDPTSGRYPLLTVEGCDVSSVTSSYVADTLTGVRLSLNVSCDELNNAHTSNATICAILLC